MHIHLTVLQTFLMEWTSKENLSKYQDILPLVITFFIPIALMFEQVAIIWREISFSSLLGLKGLKSLSQMSSPKLQDILALKLDYKPSLFLLRHSWVERTREQAPVAWKCDSQCKLLM